MQIIVKSGEEKISLTVEPDSSVEMIKGIIAERLSVLGVFGIRHKGVNMKKKDTLSAHGVQEGGTLAVHMVRVPVKFATRSDYMSHLRHKQTQKCVNLHTTAEADRIVKEIKSAIPMARTLNFWW